MSNIITLSDLDRNAEYVSQESYEKEVATYQRHIMNLNNKLIEANRNAYKDKDMIHLLKTQLQAYKEQLEKLTKTPKIKLHNPSDESESMFKKMNTQLMSAMKLSKEDQDEIRKQNEKELQEFLKL